MCRTRVPGVCICDEGSASGNNNSVESQKRRETRMHARWECSFTWMIYRSFCEHTCVHARTVPFPTYQPAKRISGLTRSGRKEERSILGVLGGRVARAQIREQLHTREDRQEGYSPSTPPSCTTSPPFYLILLEKIRNAFFPSPGATGATKKGKPLARGHVRKAFWRNNRKMSGQSRVFCGDFRIIAKT